MGCVREAGTASKCRPRLLDRISGTLGHRHGSVRPSALSDGAVRSSLGLEALDRRLCLQRVGMGRPENFRLRFENLVQHGSRIVGSALPSKCHGELISGL
jgi:hypothetical protein